MSKTGDKMVRFFRELLRRKVFRVAGAYFVAAWLLVEAADIILPTFGVAGWVLRALIVAVFLGFPIAVIFSWLFDVTPGGLERTADADDEEDEPAEARAVAVELGQMRRQVSVLHCSLAVRSDDHDETDPETFLELLPEVKRIEKEVCELFDAFRLGGDDEELQFVFGYPTTREDDATRAVAAGRHVLSEVAVDDDNLHGLTARTAVHSSMVVVNDLDPRGDVSVVGLATKLAAWLAATAEPETLVISRETSALVKNRYDCTLLGERPGPRAGSSVMAFRVDGTADAHTLTQSISTLANDLVGRDNELQLLREYWTHAVDGDGQVALLRGAAGIGKSALVRALCEEVAATEDALLVTCYCSPFESNHPLHPVIQYLRGPDIGFTDRPTAEESVERLQRFLDRLGLGEDQSAALLATLLSVPTNDAASLAHDTSQTLRQRILEGMLDALNATARRQPVLLVVEDLHWADPSTIELLGMLVQQRTHGSVLALLTARPGFAAEWSVNGDVAKHDVRHLPRRASEALIRQIGGSAALPATLVAHIVDETAGIPLYVEELTKALVESGAGGEESTSRLVIPATLKQSLSSRIDNLDEAKSLLQICSILGRDFDYRLLRAVSRTEDEKALNKQLKDIINAGFLLHKGWPPHSTYSFKHILVQETAYESLLKKTRIAIHSQIGALLERESADLKTRKPQELARHFAAGDDHEKALGYWMSACHNALASSANREAIDHAHRGLESLARLPQSAARDTREVALQSMLGKALLASRGYADPAAKQAFDRALAVCERSGDTPNQYPIVVGLWMYYVIRARYDEATRLAERLLRIAEATGEPGHVVQARYCLGFSSYYPGHLETSHGHLLKALAAETPDHDFAAQSASGDDTRIHVRCMLSHVLWHLGQPQSSKRWAEESIEMAQRLDHPYGITFASFMCAMLEQMRGAPDLTREHATRALTLAREKSYRYWIPLSEFMLSWADAAGSEAGSPAKKQHCETMSACLDDYLGAGGGAGITYLALVAAEQWLDCEQADRAEAWMQKSADYMDTLKERYFAAELTRLRGRLAACRPDGTDAAAQQSRRAAREAAEIGSLALELRAAVSLAGYLRADDAAANPSQLVAAVLARFTETDSFTNRLRDRDVRAEKRRA